MGRFSRHAATLCAAGLLIVGGGAYALAASGGGTITVCVNHKDGTLYKAKQCRAHDKTLTWNRQGPQGAPGPSNASSGSITGPVTITPSDTGEKVAHLNLQPGSYVIFAKAWIENQSTKYADTVGCELDAGAASDIDVLKLETISTTNPTNAFRGAVALNVVHTFTSGGTAQLKCSSGTGVTVTANNIVITAIKVGSLSGNALIAR